MARCSCTAIIAVLVSGEQIINNPWVWYSHIIPPMIKMSNHNITQRGTQATGLGVMIGRCSPDSQHGRPDSHATNVSCSFFRYINDDVRNHNDERPQRKTWIGKRTNLHCNAIFGATLHKEDTGKE